MAHKVIMPQMGESITEGTITTWLKKVGETVERDEPLFEISTDKVDAEIPAPAAGTILEIRAEPGTTVPIDTVVAIIGKPGESVSDDEAAEDSPSDPAERSAPVSPPAVSASPVAAAPSTARSTASAEDRRRTRSSPLVRRIAQQHGVDISAISGTGLGGRVTKNDILELVDGGGGAAPAAVASISASTGASAVVVGGEVPAAYRAQVFAGDKVEPMSKMRELIADHMVWSRRISPHVQTVWEIDFTRVDGLRRKYKPLWQERYGTNLTFTSFAMKATVDALKAFPVLNCSVDGNKVITHRAINLGMAVALDWGLIVPVIHAAEELNLLGLSKRLSDLGSRAKDKKLKPNEVQSGTFTITNPGVFGNLVGLPVINQPQVAILGMGGVEKRPAVVSSAEGGDSIAIRTRAYISLSFDHRVVDGAVADQFMGRLKQGIEGFSEDELG